AFVEETRSPAGENGNVQRLESERDAVQIMTMHKSKGLEAAVVFIYGGFTSAAKYHSDFCEYQEDGQRILYLGKNERARQRDKEERRKEHQRLLYVAMTRAKARLYLPYIHPDSWGRGWDGCYRQLNERLHAIVMDWEARRHANLFAVEPLEYRPPPAALPANKTTTGDWMPDEQLLTDEADAVAFARLRRRHAALEVTSYSRMKKLHGGYVAPVEAEEFKEDPARFAPHWLSENDLLGGAAAGTFLHEVIEEMPFESLADSPSYEAW